MVDSANWLRKMLLTPIRVCKYFRVISHFIKLFGIVNSSFKLISPQTGSIFDPPTLE